NVYFHDDECFENGKGRKVTAHDFKYTLEFACSNNKLNEHSYLLKDKIKGAEEYYNGTADEVVGIQVKDDHTLVIELKSPFSVFEKVLTHTGLGVFPKEALEKYGDQIGLHPVGTGAFILGELAEDKIVLERNNKYWDKDEFGNPLPFLDRVVMTYSKDKTDELLSFRAEKIDLVLDIPVEEVQNVLGTLPEAQSGENVKHKVDSKASLSNTYYGFKQDSEIFKDKRVRKAFNLAIDRKVMIENWLEGEGWPIDYGFVPKMKGYPYEKVKGFVFNPEEAKKLMAEAGYPNGRNFPVIPLYVNALEGSAEHKLAQAVGKSLKDNLGVNLEIRLVPIKERDELVQNGTASFWRAGWVADYPDPENFLSLFYGGNIGDNNPAVNPFKYNNPEFDRLFEQALVEADEEKRMELFAQCDQLIIDDAVVMPLINDDFITMVNLKVRKFVTNEIEQLDFSRIFIKEIN
ncbi:MAG TPA: peptide ABC transporter substrate-binding protein, partial [Brumimicrobium sp.]|nr:peptide ABC transporter substrate-binding protein [Brumimicrobium sp.]